MNAALPPRPGNLRPLPGNPYGNPLGGPTWAGTPPMPMANGGTLLGYQGPFNQGIKPQMGSLAQGLPAQYEGAPSVTPLAPMTGGGGGGGAPRGRMAPQDPTRRIGQRVGPRTSADYLAKHGGLSPRRASGLDAYYRMNPTDADAKAAAQNNFENYSKMGPMDPAKLEQAKAFASGQNWDFDPATGYMANGGTLPLPVGAPTLVGEEGPELILPREDGRGFVLPADITEQVLPLMAGVEAKAYGGTMKKPMGYAEGGTLGGEVVRTPGGTFSGFSGPAGSGFATRLPAGTQALAATATPRLMVDPSTGFQMDMDAPGLPILPDVVTGPFAQQGLPLLPEQQEALTAATQGRAQRLMAQPGAMTDQQRFDQQSVRDGVTGESLSLADMRGRVMDRSSMAYQGREEARVQRDLAARQARINAAQAQGAAGPISPLQQRMDRNMEKFLRTPQGTMWAAEQQQGMAAQQQQLQAANQWQVMPDPTTGKPFAMVNGKGQTLSLPQLKKDEQVLMVKVQKLDPITGMTIIVEEPRIYTSSTGTMRAIPMQGEAGGATPDAAGAGGGGGIGSAKTISSKEEYDQLAPGALYIWNGQQATKKG